MLMVRIKISGLRGHGIYFFCLISFCFLHLIFCYIGDTQHSTLHRLSKVEACLQCSVSAFLMHCFFLYFWQYYQCGVEMIRRDLLNGHWLPYLDRALSLRPCYEGGVNGGEVFLNDNIVSSTFETDKLVLCIWLQKVMSTH